MHSFWFRHRPSDVADRPEIAFPDEKSCAGARPAVATQQVMRLHTQSGDCVLVCPVCQMHLPEDESVFLTHLAAEHGKAFSMKGGGVGGESHQLDLLHQSSSEDWYPKRAEAQQRMHVISLGSFCGVKFSIQRLGLGAAHMPFDWIRSTLAGVCDFIRDDFRHFFSVAGRCDVPGANSRMHRSEHHSFWHDDIAEASVRAKLRRRIERFLALREDPKDLLFVRSCATTDELEGIGRLHAALEECFCPSSRRRRRVLLAVVVDGQAKFEGPIVHSSLPGVVLFMQPLAEDQCGGEAYCRAIASAVDAALTVPETLEVDVGFNLHQRSRWPLDVSGDSATVDSEAVEEPHLITFCDVGLQSGYGDLACFEEPGKQHFDLSTPRDD